MKRWIALGAVILSFSSSVQAGGGLVRLDRWALADDNGPFNAVGFTLMSGLRLYRSDRGRLDLELSRAAEAGYHFTRILAEVDSHPWEYANGPRSCDPKAERDCVRGYWWGLGVDPRWSDYDRVFTGYLQHAYSKGLRTEVTLFGGSPWSMSGGNARQTRRDFVRRMIRLIRPHREAVLYVEIVNEPGIWDKISDLDEMAEYAGMVRNAFPGMVVAMGAPLEGTEQRYADRGFPLTLHFSRDVAKGDGNWRPVRQPWEASTYGQPFSNNEPIGPGSSVSSDGDCERHVAHALTTFISKGFAYVFHTAPGVRSLPGDRGFSSGLVSEVPCFAEVARAASLLPPGQANLGRENGHWPGSPFKNLDEFIEGRDNGRRGLMRIYNGASGGGFSSVLLHVPVGVRLECRREGPVSFHRLPDLGIERREDCAPGRTFALGHGSVLALGGSFADRKSRPSGPGIGPGPDPNPSPGPDPNPKPSPGTGSVGAAPLGWDARRWNDPNHNTPKYVVGRILSRHPHTAEGLQQALPDVQSAFPGTGIRGKDLLNIPGVGVIDVIQALDSTGRGRAWQWLVVEDHCPQSGICDLKRTPPSPPGLLSDSVSNEPSPRGTLPLPNASGAVTAPAHGDASPEPAIGAGAVALAQSTESEQIGERPAFGEARQDEPGPARRALMPSEEAQALSSKRPRAPARRRPARRGLQENIPEVRLTEETVRSACGHAPLPESLARLYGVENASALRQLRAELRGHYDREASQWGVAGSPLQCLSLGEHLAHMINQQLSSLAESLEAPGLAGQGLAFSWEGLAVTRTLREGLTSGEFPHANLVAAP